MYELYFLFFIELHLLYFIADQKLMKLLQHTSFYQRLSIKNK